MTNGRAASDFDQTKVQTYCLSYWKNLQSNPFTFLGWCDRSPHGSEYFVKLLPEPLGNGLPIDGKNQLCLVRWVFHHLEACTFGIKLPPMLFRIEFAFIEKRFAANECCGLPFVKPYQAAKAFHAQDFFRQRKQGVQFPNKAFQPRNLFFVFRFPFLHFLVVLPLHCCELIAVFLLLPLHLFLQ